MESVNAPYQGTEDWKDLSSILNGFRAASGELEDQDFLQKFENYVKQKLDQDALLKIPSLNSVPLDQLKSGALVKYRCMVQDIFDPQFCLGRYKIVNTSTGASRTDCGYFKDFPSLGPSETIDFDNPDNVTVERQSFYCVPIPGEAHWVKEAYIKRNVDHRKPSSSKESNRSKRSRDDGDDEAVLSSELKSSKPETSSESIEKTEAVEKEKERMEMTDNAASASNVSDNKSSRPAGVSLNMPLPDETGIPCIVRVYSPEVELKTTDSAEIVGILSTDPQLAAIYDDDSVDEGFDSAELQAHEPPPSLVPRLHALLVRPLHHNNPSLPSLPLSKEFETAKKQLLQDALSLRLELLSVLEHALLGDRLGAEYLLCHLVARIYARADVLPLGKMCLNLSGCPPTQRYTQLLHFLIAQLSTQAVNFEMTIDNTNNWRLIPKKDHKLNRLTSGMLQLSSGTNLVIDETALHQGTLNQNGLTNVKALADVINWQKVDYDFEFHPIPVHTDINVLILSEGESLLPKDFLVPLTCDNQVLDIPAHFEKLDSRLTPENIEKLRSFLTVCQTLKYSVPEETQKTIQEDFVESRQSNPKNMTVEDFQKLLCLVRLQTLSYGKESPTVEMWNKVRGMEEERKLRLSHLPSRQDRTNQQ